MPETHNVAHCCRALADALGIAFEDIPAGRASLAKLRTLLATHLDKKVAAEIGAMIEEENLLFLKNDPASTRYAILPTDEAKVDAILSIRRSMSAIAAHRLIHTLWQQWCDASPEVHLSIELLQSAVKAMTGVDIHPGATIGRRFLLDHGTGFVLGETAVIGDDCSAYHGSTIGASGVALDGRRHPKLGNNVRLGNGVKLLGPITIGDDVEIGCDAIVINADIGAGALIDPAAVVRGVIVPSDVRIIRHIKANAYEIRARNSKQPEIRSLEWSTLRRSTSANVAANLANTTDPATAAREIRGGLMDTFFDDGAGI